MKEDISEIKIKFTSEWLHRITLARVAYFRKLNAAWADYLEDVDCANKMIERYIPIESIRRRKLLR